MQWDVCIIHVREDNAAARSLAQALRRHGLAVSGEEQEPGAGLRARVDAALARARWCVVLLSPRFLEKDWPREELDALLAPPVRGERPILPVWHGVAGEDVARRSPMLAARLSAGTERGMDAVRDAVLASVVPRPSKPRRTALLPLWLSLLEDPGFSLAQVHHHLARREAYAGQAIGPYTLRALIGVGGSGAVFRAVHGALGRQVALKLFFPFGDDLRVIQQATERAVRGLSCLRHPGIAPLLDYGYLRISIGAAPYLAHELVEGASLLEWSRGGEADSIDRHSLLSRRLNVAIAAAEALHHAHGCHTAGELGFAAAGVMHGDLKPANVIVRRDDEHPVLLDFMMPGIQRMAAERLIRWNSWEKDTEGRYQELPTTHSTGAPGYVPPEQEVDGIITPASDVYALGRTFRDLFWPDAGAPRADAAPAEGEVARLVAEMTASQPDERPALDAGVLQRLRRILAAHHAGAPSHASAPA